MILFKTKKDIERKLASIKNKQQTIGFVPTMGALHEGHLSLIRLSKKQNDITVCSIFINQPQFNDKEDFKKYPITIENDILLLEENKTDILFLPSEKEIYPEGIYNLTHFNLGEIENILEGKFRSGHFQGVCQVVDVLLKIIQPDKLYLGQKDYQQCMIIKKMIEVENLHVETIISSTLREPSGLAMSSRNMHLSDEQKKQASSLYQSLLFIKEKIAEKDFDDLKSKATEMLLKNGFDKIDYIEIADAATLSAFSHFDKNKKIVILAAAFINGVRLIDNLLIE